MTTRPYSPTHVRWIDTVNLVTSFMANPHAQLSISDFQRLIRMTFTTVSSLERGSVSVREPMVGEGWGSMGADKITDFENTDFYGGFVAARELTVEEIRNSIGADKITSFEDGKSYRSLRRHLAHRGITPDEYRARWRLPNDYPMVHPSLSAQRSKAAKALDLSGAKKRKAERLAANGGAPTLAGAAAAEAGAD